MVITGYRVSGHRTDKGWGVGLRLTVIKEYGLEKKPLLTEGLTLLL